MFEIIEKEIKMKFSKSLYYFIVKCASPESVCPVRWLIFEVAADCLSWTPVSPDS